MDQIERSNARMAISQPSDAPLRIRFLKNLFTLAEARQAAVSESTLKLYVSTLMDWPVEDVEQVCTKIATSPRREGETAFPPLGNILEDLRACKAAKLRTDKAKANAAFLEQSFWDHIEWRMEATGQSEQDVLDSIRQPGFIGRKARGTQPSPAPGKCAG